MSDHRPSWRERQFLSLFACTFVPEATQRTLDSEADSFVKKLLQHLPEIDAQLTTAAPERPITDINKVDLAILRLSVFEWTEKGTPPKVLLNEAIELAKKYGSDTSYRLVNGVLGKLLLQKDAPGSAVDKATS